MYICTGRRTDLAIMFKDIRTLHMKNTQIRLKITVLNRSTNATGNRVKSPPPDFTPVWMTKADVHLRPRLHYMLVFNICEQTRFRLYPAKKIKAENYIAIQKSESLIVLLSWNFSLIRTASWLVWQWAELSIDITWLSLEACQLNAVYLKPTKRSYSFC